MSPAAIDTVLKLIESLPESAQARVAEHPREYIADTEDEELWDASFARTQARLVDVARQAIAVFAEGKSAPLDRI